MADSRMRAWKWALPATALAVFLVQFAIQPAIIYPGDAEAIRMEASYLVSHGSLGIPLASPAAAAIAPELIPPQSHEDQYFWLNHERKAYFARWGIGNTLAFAIPLLFSNPDPRGARLRVLNTYNAALTALLVAGILFACARGGLSVTATVPFALAWLYSSYLLYYARMQSAEIVQCVLIVWAFVAFREANARLDADRPSGGMVVAMNLLLAILTLAKIQFAAVWGLALVCTFLRRKSLRSPIAISVAVIAVAFAVQLGIDTVKFGSPFEIGKLGYPFPHETAGWGFSIKEYAASIPDFLWGVRGGVVRFAPLVLVGVLGVRGIARRAPREAVFVWGTLLFSILIAGATINHNGEWSIGPRYLVQAVALLAIPAAEAFAVWTEAVRPVRVRALAWVGVAAVALIGVRDEACACFFSPFAAHQVDGILRAGPIQPEGAAYLDHATRLEVLRDLRAFCDNQESPVTAIFADELRRVGPENATHALTAIRAHCTPNLALFPHPTG